MSAVPKQRRPSTEHEGLVLHIPPSAFTFAGFRDWIDSRAFPDNVRVTFVKGEMFLDFRGEDLFLHIPAAAHTVDGFRKWVKSDELPEKMRVTYLDGEITLDMSKEELETHNKVKTAVMVALVNLDPDAKAGTVYTDGVLITNTRARVSNNPDGVYLSRESRRAGRVRMVKRKGKAGQYLEIAGSPDWVMEVVSDSSVKKDKQELRKAYHKAGIREYWLIDARGRAIDFQILVWAERGYAPATKAGGWQRSAVFGRLFRLTRKRDADGDWLYRLEAREE